MESAIKRRFEKEPWWNSLTKEEQDEVVKMEFAKQSGGMLETGRMRNPVKINRVRKKILNERLSEHGICLGGGDTMTNEDLVARIRAGMDTADNMLALYLQNKGMIWQIAKKYSGLTELEDLAQEGYIGLCQAVEGYDLDKGVPFASYAWVVIQKHLLRYARGEKNLPEYLQNLTGQYKALTSSFLIRYGRKPRRREYVLYLDITGEQLKVVEKALQMEQQASLDALIGEGDATLADTLPGSDDVEGTVLEEVQQAQVKAVLWAEVGRLQEGQSAVIQKRYQENLTLQQTAEALGLATVGITKGIERSALNKLWHNPRIRNLDDIRSAGMRGTGLETFKRTWTSATERAAIGN